MAGEITGTLVELLLTVVAIKALGGSTLETVVVVGALVETVLTVRTTGALDESVTVVLVPVVVGMVDVAGLGVTTGVVVVILVCAASLTSRALVESIIALWTRSWNVSACSISFSTSSSSTSLRISSSSRLTISTFS